eukprot:340066_1
MRVSFNTCYDVDADYLSNSINQIILSRKNKPKSLPKLKLDHVPKQLIGVISSFLPQFDYINFSKTNRFIYLGCNSPNKLHELNLKPIEHYSSIDLTLYPSIHRLALDLSKCNKLMHGSVVLNELCTLSLNINNTDFDIDLFLKHNWVNVNHITYLEFSIFDHVLLSSQWTKIFSKFPNVQYLKLNCYVDGIDPDILKENYPNLRGLYLCVCEQSMGKCQHLIDVFGSTLECLSLDRILNLGVHDINFASLEQLQLRAYMHIGEGSQIVRDILKTAKNAKRIGFCVAHNDSQIVNTVLSSTKSLQYIELQCLPNTFEFVLSGLKDGLYQIKKWKRKQFKVHISMFMESDNQLNVAQYIEDIAQVSYSLHTLATHWMFILEFHGLEKDIYDDVCCMRMTMKFFMNANISMDVFGTD